MGWESYRATEYKHGKIDRKAEIDKGQIFTGKVIKSVMIGSTYYAAVDTGEKVVGGIVLTHTEGNEFFYKEMDETCGPSESKCPAVILDLLSPTTDPDAAQWRARCRASIAARKITVKIDRTRDYIFRCTEDIRYRDGFVLEKGKEVIATPYRKRGWTCGMYKLPADKLEAVGQA